MLYNDVELFDIESVWTDKETYPYVVIIQQNWDLAFKLWVSSTVPFINNSDNVAVHTPYSAYAIEYKYTDGTWVKNHEASSIASGLPAHTIIWSNSNIYKNTDNSLFFSASNPVPVGGFSGTMTHYATNFGSNHSHTTFEVGGLSDSDTYFIRGYCYQDSSLIATVDSPSWTGSGTYCTVEFSGLTPSTTYDFEYVLYVNDTETSVTYTNSVTTLEASSGGDDSGDGGAGDGGGSSGGCAECPSILSSILSAITNQSTFLSNWKQDWSTRMDGFEESILSAVSALAPVPDPAETALKTATTETVTAVTNEFWGSDSDTAISPTNITESANVLSNVKNMFDIGVSTSDFFGLFGDSSWSYWFSEETRADLDTVPSVSTLDLYENEEKSTYEKNLDIIRDFMGG